MKQRSEHKLLVVDDSAIQLKLLSRFLESEGYQVVPTSSAREALAMIQEQRPDLIISDLIMPEMSGFELCDRIKRDLSLQTIPVILLTSLSEPGDILQGLAVGGDSYVLKPYDEADLLGKVERLLAMSAEEVRAGLEEIASVEYRDEQYDIHADSPRIIHFLLTTYENAIEKNRALVATQIALQEKSHALEVQFRKLQESENRFSSLVELVPDIIYRIDVEGNFLYLNSAVRQLGYKPDELIGQHFSVMMLPSDAESVSRSFLLPKLADHATGDEGAPKLFDERRTGERATRTLDMRLLCKGKAGDERIGVARAVSEDMLMVEINSSGFYLPDGKEKEKRLLGTVGVIRDITERKQNEIALRRSEHGLTEAQRIAHLGNWEWDIVSNELNWSGEVYRIFGLQAQEFGETYEAFLEAIPPAEREMVQAAVTEALEGPEHEYDIEHRVVRPDGRVREVHEQAEVILDAKGQPLSMIGTVQDITERKQLEEELQEYQGQLEEKVKARTRELEKAMAELKATQQYMIQSEKLSSLGTLAAGVAHEMNNPIMGIINYVEYAQKHIEHERGGEMLSRADKELRRVADIVKGMLTFSRPPSEEMAAVDVGEAFHHAQQLLATDLRNQNIEVELNIADELPRVLAKSDSLEQVFLNLLMNARDAMKKVESRRIKVDMSLRAGYVVIGICDSGPGIEENILTNIFDPFFTSKPPGQGTGLGLYISRNLVNGFNGELSCEGDHQGSGACFMIKLPSIAPVDL